MPNNIKNILKISGGAKFIDEIIGKEFNFANTVPPPKGLEPMMSIKDSKWFVENWGTKWPPYEVICKRENKKVELLFYTAWDAPLIWIKKTIKLFPNLKYDLMWCDIDNFPEYYGHLKYVDGKITIEKHENNRGKLDIKFVKKYFNDEYVEYMKWKIVNDKITKITNDFNKNVSPNKMIEMYINMNNNYEMDNAGIIFWKKSENSKINNNSKVALNDKSNMLKIVKAHLIKYGLECKIVKDQIKILGCSI